MFVEKIKTRIFIFNTPSPENRVVYEIMWQNVTEPDRLELEM
jgi:hypothetical protein